MDMKGKEASLKYPNHIVILLTTCFLESVTLHLLNLVAALCSSISRSQYTYFLVISDPTFLMYDRTILVVKSFLVFRHFGAGVSLFEKSLAQKTREIHPGCSCTFHIHKIHVCT